MRISDWSSDVCSSDLHDRFDGLALAMQVERVLARNAPGDVGHVDHAVHIAVEPDEQAELGRVLDLALAGRADRGLLGEGLPRIRLRLLEAPRDTALLFVHLGGGALAFPR